MTSVVPSSEDLYLLHEGSLYQSYKILGAHVSKQRDKPGVRFTVWAPHAREVWVVGDFNGWSGSEHVMLPLSTLGVWMLFVPEAKEYDYYKYEIYSQDGRVLTKADPYAVYSELRPGTASRVYDLDGYDWQDQEWQKHKETTSVYQNPLSIYEVHLGTWKKEERHSDVLYSYRHLADELVDYVADMGYTHIELMPLAEHPFDRSWGYQATGYYSVTSRHGSPKDFMYFVDRCHQRGIGVIMDWVPGHFCKDDHGLRQFDGQPLYEYEDPRKAEKHEWGTSTFDFGRPEVISYLISNAVFWMDVYHIDGIRVDAVASMLLLNFGKSDTDPLIHNQWGGDNNPEAISLIRKLNQVIFSLYPNALMMAEDSTDWPLVTKPVHEGGLGFNFKWNMGWMNDMLRYMKLDPFNRSWHHKLITFSFMYTFSENYILPLSHDEVVHGKRSLLHKMPGDYWQKFANLRVFYGYMTGHPGKKLLFMGGEFGQFDEWKDLEELDWFLLDYDMHRKMHHYVKDLNCFYRSESALWQYDHEPQGFQWINPHDESQSVVVFIRKGKLLQDDLILVCNFTPVYHPDYRIGVPLPGIYQEVFNSDMEIYGGSGKANSAKLISVNQEWHQFPHSLAIQVPPLGAIFIKCIEDLPKNQLKSDG